MTIAVLGRPLIPRLPPRLVFRPGIGARQFSKRNSGKASRSPTVKDVRKFAVPARDGADADVQPGEHVFSVSKKHNISFPASLQKLKLKIPDNSCKLSVQFSRHHCFDARSMKYLDRVEHPMTQTILDVYIAQKKKPLWYSTYAVTNMRPFAVSEAERKVKHALRDALAAHGYDRDGRRVATDDSVVAELFGTLKVTIQDPKKVYNSKFADLLRPAELIISAAEMELRRGKDGKHLALPHSQPAKQVASSNRKHTSERDVNTAKSTPTRGPVKFRKINGRS